MAKIIERIKIYPLFYTYLFLTEITFLAVFWGIFFTYSCGSKMGNIRFLSDIGFYSFLIAVPFFLILHISGIILSFFVSQIKKFKKTMFYLFLLRLLFICFALTIFAYSE